MASTEQNSNETDNTGRTVFIIVAVISVVLVSGVIWLIKKAGTTTGSEQPRLEGALRAGSPEFDAAKKMVSLDAPEAVEAKRAIGDIVMTLETTVRNFTGKTINGLEIYAAVVDSQGKPVKDRTVIVIPTRQPELDNNKTMKVPVMLEGMHDSDNRANIKMEVTAIRFKQ
ncbi:MAG: hypothetical protein WCB68_06340 [Pyrinomonadaceae bacterium]